MNLFHSYQIVILIHSGLCESIVNVHIKELGIKPCSSQLRYFIETVLDYIVIVILSELGFELFSPLVKKINANMKVACYLRFALMFTPVAIGLKIVEDVAPINEPCVYFRYLNRNVMFVSAISIKSLGKTLCNSLRKGC